MDIAGLEALYAECRHNPNYQYRNNTDEDIQERAVRSYARLTEGQKNKVSNSWITSLKKNGREVTADSAMDMVRYRFMAQTNLYFLCHLLESYNQTTVQTHEYICNSFFVQKDPTFASVEKFASKDNYTELHDRMLLVPRGGFKSSIDIADCVQWVIAFPAVTIMILTGVYSLAGDFVGELRSHFENDESVEFNDPKTGKPLLVPKLLMDKESGAWSESMFQVLFSEHCINPNEGKQTEFQTPAIQTSKEPTVRSGSIEQALVGQHFDVMKLDDVITNENTQTVERMNKINKFISVDRAMLHPYGFQDIIGTWYDEKDFYGKRIKYEEDYAKKNGVSHLVVGSVDSGRLDIAVKMKIHLRSAWWLTPSAKALGKSFEDATEADYELWFPERLDYKFLETERDSDPDGFAIKYLNNPRQIHKIKFERGLLVSKTIPHNQLPQQGAIVATMDTAYSTKSWADYTVMITAMISEGRFYIVNMMRGRFDEHALPIKIAETANRWKPRQIAIEESVGVKWLGKEIKREFNKLQISVPIHYMSLGLGSKSKSKAIKAKPVRRLLGDGRILFANSCEGLEEIYNELEAFTGTESDTHDDIVSALSLLVEHFGAYAEQGAMMDAMNTTYVADAQAHDRHQLVYGLGKYAKYNAQANYVPEENDSPKTMFQLEENQRHFRVDSGISSGDPLSDLMG